MKTSSLKPITARHAHGGFTLVELLLVIAIIAVLSTMAVGIIASSQNDARVAATRSRINIIDRIIQAELENYEFRRSPVPERVLIVLTNQLIRDNGWDEDRFLVHFRNLKRMINADLIRTEMPSGRVNINSNLGRFPSAELRAYLNNVGVSNASTPISIPVLERFRPAGVRRWSNWAYDFQSGRDGLGVVREREREEIRSDSAEILYRLLGQIEFNGTSALDALGSSAVGDADGDEQLEIVDAFGDPIGFQFLQENLTQTPSDVTDGVWASSDFVADLQYVPDPEGDLAPDDPAGLRNAVRPVRADQVRGFFSSNALDEINGETEGPADLANN